MTKNLSIKQIFAQANKAMLLFAVIPLLLSILLYSATAFDLSTDDRKYPKSRCNCFEG